MSKRIAACEESILLSLDCEKVLRRDFQRRVALSIACVALGLVGVLTHFA